MKEENINNKIKNKALELAVSEILTHPIQDRLKEEYPELNNHILNELNSLCQTIRTQGYSFIYETLDQSKMGQKALKRLYDDYLKSQYPWISKKTHLAYLVMALI